MIVMHDKPPLNSESFLVIFSLISEFCCCISLSCYLFCSLHISRIYLFFSVALFICHILSQHSTCITLFFLLYHPQPQDIVYRSSLPVYRFLRIMGIFPYTRDGPGQAQFVIFSRIMGYSVGIFLLLLVIILNHKLLLNSIAHTIYVICGLFVTV